MNCSTIMNSYVSFFFLFSIVICFVCSVPVFFLLVSFLSLGDIG